MDQALRKLTIQRVLVVTLFALLFVIATRVPVDTDTWWHLRSGEYTLNEGMIYQDPFSHTRLGEDWTNHSWGAQIVMHLSYEVAGDLGLAVYTAALAVIGLGFLYPILKGNAYLRAFVLMLIGITASVFWSARPQMVSFAFSGLTLYLLFKRKQGVDWLWFFPLMMLLWGNMHAGFSIGFIFLAGVTAGEVAGNVLHPERADAIDWRGVRKLIIVGVLSVAALVVNPYGLAMLRVPFETVSIGALRQFIQEWQSPNFQEAQTWPFIFMVIAILGLNGATKRAMDWAAFVLAAGTFIMALFYGRNIAVFAVAAAPALAAGADALLKERGWDLQPRTSVTRRQARLNALLVGLVLIGVMGNTASVLNPETVDQFQRENLPVDAADFITEAQPPGPMFNSYNWGGYLMWALPGYPVYVDGRTDLYRSDFLMRWLDAALGRDGWRETLDDDGINLVVVERGSGLANRLRDEPDWSQAYPTPDVDDDKVVIYVRSEPLSDSTPD